MIHSLNNLDNNLLDSYSNTITNVVSSVADSVVHISVKKKNNNKKDPREFLEGAGSGFVISSDGYIVTNNHVIENSNKIKVSFSSGKTTEAELKGTDPSTDIAVIKVDFQGLKALSYADSDQLKAGQIAIAIGNPLGFQNTVTAGIIQKTNNIWFTPH